MTLEPREVLQSGRVVTQEATGRLLYFKVVEVLAAGTRVQVPAGPGVMSITVQGADDNAGKVYIGDNTVGNAGDATIGFALGPGVDFGPLQLERPAQLWVDADNAGDKLVILGVM